MKPLPCPCCKSTDLRVGPYDCTRSCVQCRCGLRMVVDYEEVWEEAVKGVKNGNEALDNATRLSEEEAVRRWNNR